VRRHRLLIIQSALKGKISKRGARVPLGFGLSDSGSEKQKAGGIPATRLMQ
jgi:hypothetical protein